MRQTITAHDVVTSETEVLDAARGALLAEAAAIRMAAERLDGNLTQAVARIAPHRGKIVVTGIGKSGHIGQKIAATLCSTGTMAVFLHAAEAAHGDLGIYTPGDPTILISKSGATAEILRLIPILREFDSPLIGILGNIASPLAAAVDIVLDARVGREADPLDLAPTCSSTVALAIGDALAAALMRARHFTNEDFARFHPSGQLGRNLLMRVADVMHPVARCAFVQPTDPLRDVVIAMTERPLGAACVVDGHARLAGLITDGDLRRALRRFDDIRPLTAAEVMTPHPLTIDRTASLKEAAQIMEDRPSQISVLPVVDPGGTCVGLLRIHDIYQASLS
jgi:arabinose-5-phosphate isomerase